MKLCCLLILLISAQPLLLPLSPGSIDPSFGTRDGYTTTEIAGLFQGALGIALQNDDKIVTAGVSGDFHTGKFAIVRYTKNGSPDTLFGPDATGIVTKTIGPGATADYATDVKIKSNGKIISSGFTSTANYTRFALLQLKTDGSVDTNFGDNGVVTTRIGSDDWAYSTAMALQSDGKIVVVGFWYEGDYSSFVIVRYATDGSLDTSFGSDHTGIVKLPIESEHSSWAGDVKIQPDGKIIVGGYYHVSDADGDAFQLVRLLADGTPDPAFGTNHDGIVRTTGVKSAMLDFINVCGITLQSDGNIIFVGNSGKSGHYEFALARYSGVDGSLDTTFGVDHTGIVYTTIGSQAFALCTLIQPDDKILVTGASWVAITQQKLLLNRVNQLKYQSLNIYGILARYTNSGELDTDFGENGYVSKQIDVMTRRVTLFGRMVLQGNGKLVTSGGAGNYTVNMRNRGASNFETFVARYIVWSNAIPQTEIDAAKAVIGCPGLMASDVDASARFYEVLREKYEDCRQPRAKGIRC